MPRAAVERATSLSNVLSNKLLANLVGSVKDLPVLPRTSMALRQKLAEPEASVRDVVQIVEQDVAISAEVLQLVNSAYFGLPREISSVRTAVGFLGVDTLQNLVLSYSKPASIPTAAPVTTPSDRPSPSSSGPCSMWSSR